MKKRILLLVVCCFALPVTAGKNRSIKPTQRELYDCGRMNGMREAVTAITGKPLKADNDSEHMAFLVCEEVHKAFYPSGPSLKLDVDVKP